MYQQKELKRRRVEEMKGSILALLAEGYSERQVASMLTMSKMAVQKNKVKQRTSGIADSFRCHSTTVG